MSLRLAAMAAMLLNSLLLISTQQPLSDEEMKKLIAIFGSPQTNTAPVTTAATATATATTMTEFSLNPVSNNEIDIPCMTKDKKQGVCVTYYQCDPETKRAITDGATLIDVRKDECGSYFDVCCLTDLVNTTSRENASKPAASDEPPPECGYSNPGANAFRVQNDGTIAEFGEYPWMVAILKKSQAGISWSKDDYIGGGSIIHPKVVLTSAHKIEDIDPKSMKCRAGEWDSQTVKEFYPHQERDVKSFVLHEDFYRASAINNVGLIFLEKPFEISADTPHMGVACLGHTLPAPGTKCESMGWGNENFNNPDKYAVTLKKVELPLVSRDTCQNRLRGTRLGSRFQLHKSFICAGGKKGVDTCGGDGGSSLVCRIEDGSAFIRYAIYGTVAWGIGCGEDGLPGVYVNVPDFRPWIVKTVQAEGLDPSSFEYTE